MIGNDLELHKSLFYLMNCEMQFADRASPLVHVGKAEAFVGGCLKCGILMP